MADLHQQILVRDLSPHLALPGGHLRVSFCVFSKVEVADCATVTLASSQAAGLS